MTAKVLVLVVDDSFMMRTIIKNIVNNDPDLQLVGDAPDGVVALEMVRTHRPDVILLDLEMPRMDGIEFMKRLRLISKAKVIVVSSAIQLGSPQAMEVRRLGAKDIVEKPAGALSLDLAGRKGEEILSAIRHAMGAP